MSHLKIKIPVKILAGSVCAERFNFDVKGLMAIEFFFVYNFSEIPTEYRGTHRNFTKSFDKRNI
jgi:hypothetical protein